MATPGDAKRRRAAAYKAGEQAERNRLLDLYERDPEQFAVVVAENRLVQLAAERKGA